MGLSFRKSFGNSLFRINLSKSGVSYSTGFKGARLNVGPKGTYVTFSSHGLQYRKKLDSPQVVDRLPQESQPVPIYNGMHTITSADVDLLTDTDSKNFIEELTEKAAKYSLQLWLAIIPFAIGVLLLLINSFDTRVVQVSAAEDQTVASVTSEVGANVRRKPDAKSEILKYANSGEDFNLLDSSNKRWLKIQLHDSIGYISRKVALINHNHTDSVNSSETFISNKFFWVQSVLLIAAFIFLYLWTGRLDKKRLEMELVYEMDEKVQVIHDQFINHFKDFTRSSKIWQYLHASRTSDYKRTGGAGQLISRIGISSLSSDRKPLKYFKTNVDIPYIKLRNTELYFLPERLLIKRGQKFGAVFYKNINIASRVTRFIEDESVPRDAAIVGHTWKYLNKGGGLDRRFKNNRQIPICHYSEYTIQSGTGIYEIISTSKIGAFDNFSKLITQIGALQSHLQLS